MLLLSYIPWINVSVNGCFALKGRFFSHADVAVVGNLHQASLRQPVQKSSVHTNSPNHMARSQSKYQAGADETRTLSCNESVTRCEDYTLALKHKKNQSHDPVVCSGSFNCYQFWWYDFGICSFCSKLVIFKLILHWHTMKKLTR